MELQVQVTALQVQVTALLLPDMTLLRAVPLLSDNSLLCPPDLPLPQVTSSSRTWLLKVLKVLPTITEVPLEEAREDFQDRKALPDLIADLQEVRALPHNRLTEVDKAPVRLDRTLDPPEVNNKALPDFLITERDLDHKAQLDLIVDLPEDNNNNNNSKALPDFPITEEDRDHRVLLDLTVDLQEGRALQDFPIMDQAQLKDHLASKRLMETLLHPQYNLDHSAGEAHKMSKLPTQLQGQVPQP